MEYTNLEILIRGEQVEVDTDYGHFALIGLNDGSTPELYVLEDDVFEPVTLDGEIQEPWTEDESTLGDIHDIYQYLEQHLWDDPTV